MRTSLLVSLTLALVACKGSESKKTDEGSGTASASGKPAVMVDAATAKPVVVIDAAPAAAAGDLLQKPFFYRVTKDGKTSHLLGSIHLGVPASRMPPVVWDAAKAAKSFAMEADISDVMGIAKKMMRTDGGSLEADLGPEYWKKLDAAIGASIPFGLKSIDGMKPMIAQAQLEAMGLPAADLSEAIDLAFLEAAKKAGAEINFLEEAGHQFDVLERWSDIPYLKHQLDHLDEIKAAHTALYESYVAGDEAAMEMKDDTTKEDWLAMGRKPEDFETMKKELLYDRNEAWMPKVKELASRGDAFIVVGAAHLVGDGSVNDLLRKDGFTVERVTP